MTATETSTTQVYRVYLKATAEAIWDAITKPEWTERYGYTGFVDYDLRPGGAYKVRATEPFRAASSAMGNELPIHEFENGVCSLTLTHELEGAPKLAMIVGGKLEAEGAGGGHAWVLSDLKTLLETGKSFEN